MELLTVRETAEILKVTSITIRRYIAAGRLPAVKAGKGVRVRKEALDQFITPVAPTKSEGQLAPRRTRLFSRDDSLFSIIGVARGASEDGADVSENKLKYLAEAYAAKAR